MRLTIKSAACVLAMLSIAAPATSAFAQQEPPAVPLPTATPPAPPAYRPAAPLIVPTKQAQGVAVLGTSGTRDEAFTLGRAVYASKLRPSGLDDAHAKILAGDPAKDDAPKELKELAELRAGITGEDAASKRLLAGIAKDLSVEAILFVTRETRETKDADSDAGAPTPVAPVAHLFLADSGEIDAARYIPEPGVEGSLAWRATVASLERRFAHEAAPIAATKPLPPPVESSPFYKSGWFWGAVGAAALAGAAFYFLGRDTSTDSIHLQMNVPR